MASQMSGYEGYTNKVIPFKTADGLELSVDVLYPSAKLSSPPPVLIHYHGGFLVSLCYLFTRWCARQRTHSIDNPSSH